MLACRSFGFDFLLFLFIILVLVLLLGIALIGFVDFIFILNFLFVRTQNLDGLVLGISEARRSCC